jgi:hypothetical protein
MASRIEELFEELAENIGDQQQFQIDQQLEQQEAQRELYDTDEARTALKIIGGLGLLALTRGRSGGKGLPPDLLNKAYGQVGQDFRKYIIPPLTQVGRRLTGRSGSGVGTDVVGRNPLPKIKDPVVTKRGPRGPTNIEQPPAGPPRPAPSRNTSLSETDQEMIKRLLIPPLTQTGRRGIPSTTTGRRTKSYMDNVRQTKLTEQQTNRLKFLEDELRIDQAKINAGEAPSKNFNKMLEEAARLRQLLKQ